MSQKESLILISTPQNVVLFLLESCLPLFLSHSLNFLLGYLWCESCPFTRKALPFHTTTDMPISTIKPSSVPHGSEIYRYRSWEKSEISSRLRIIYGQKVKTFPTQYENGQISLWEKYGVARPPWGYQGRFPGGNQPYWNPNVTDMEI